MANVNIANNGQISGNLVDAPKVFDNADGSKSVRLTVAYDDDYIPAGEKNPGTKYLDLEAFINKKSVTDKGLGVYAYLTKGSSVSIAYETSNNNYTKKDGTKVYGLKAEIRGVKLHDTNAKLAELKAKFEAEVAAKGAPAAPAAPVTQVPAVPEGVAVDPLA